MYNIRCLGVETDVHDCKYDRQSTGNCSGTVNVNCGKKLMIRNKTGQTRSDTLIGKRLTLLFYKFKLFQQAWISIKYNVEKTMNR